MARRVKEPMYVPIYCSERAVHDAQYAPANPHMLGRCFARRFEERWFCCCCAKPVSVVW